MTDTGASTLKYDCTLSVMTDTLKVSDAAGSYGKCTYVYAAAPTGTAWTEPTGTYGSSSSARLGRV